MRQWLIDILIRDSDRVRIIRKLGGYPDIASAVQAIKKEDKEQRFHILTMAVKRLFNTVSKDDILHVNEYGQWLYKGRPLGETEVNQLKSEATELLKMKLWEVLVTEVKYQSNKAMFEKSQTEMDMIAGKVTLFIFDAIETRLKQILQWKVVKS